MRDYSNSVVNVLCSKGYLPENYTFLDFTGVMHFSSSKIPFFFSNEQIGTRYWSIFHLSLSSKLLQQTGLIYNCKIPSLPFDVNYIHLLFLIRYSLTALHQRILSGICLDRSKHWTLPRGNVHLSNPCLPPPVTYKTISYLVIN